MKILFVLENYYPHIGGVEVVFKNLAEGLANLGHDVNLVTHQLKNTKRYEIINKVKIHRIPCFHSRYWFSFLSIPKVISLAKKADIIHTTTYNGAVPARFASKILKKPAIITVHEVLGKDWEKLEGLNLPSAKLHKFLESLVMNLNFTYFISVSKSTEKAVLKLGIKKSKSDVIYNGINYSFFDPKKHSKTIIRKKLNIHKKFIYMFYGRPGISKGLEYLLKAVPIISKKIPNSKLVAIVSKDKAYKKRYNHMLNLIKNLKIQNNILLLDPVKYNEIPKYIKAADCIVVPSLSEGFGFTAAEASAMKTPVVASNTHSLPEVVSGKYVLVEPRKPEEIAKGVILIYRDEVKDKGKKIFKWEDNIKSYLKVYKRLLSE